MKKLIIATSIALAFGLVAAPPPPPEGKGAPKKGGSVGKMPAPQQRKPHAGVPKPAPSSPMVKPHPGPGKYKQGPSYNRQEMLFKESHRKTYMQGAGGFSPPPHHNGFHSGRPHGARYWGRPPMPPAMAGAHYHWSWVPTPWSYTIDGVYYYGEGYYYDGYNYCYNGGFHNVPPPVQVVQPAVVAPVQPTVVVPQQQVVVPQQQVVVPQQQVVVPAQPTVVTPTTTVVTPAPATPPPPPPRRGGILGWLFGN